MFKNLIQKIFKRDEWERTLGAARSPRWAKFRDEFLKGKTCAVCAREDRNELHHIIPFWKRPDLELTESNVIVLCDGSGTRKDHLYFGHLGSWRSWNEDVRSDCEIWNKKIKMRP